MIHRQALGLVVAALILGCGLCGCSRQAEEESSAGKSPEGTPWPVRWTDELTLNDLAEINAALDQPVDMGGNSPKNRLVLSNYAANPDLLIEAEVTTGRQYLQLLADGCSAQSTFAITMRSFFINKVESLVHLSYAKPAAKSYVADFRLDEIDAGSLPAAMFVWGAWPDENYRTLAEIEPDFQVGSASAQEINIMVPYARHSFFVVGWGDFNWDGVEDVMLYKIFHATEGTMRWYELVFLTRLSADGPLVGDTFAQNARGSWETVPFGGEEMQLRWDEAARRLRAARD